MAMVRGLGRDRSTTAGVAASDCVDACGTGVGVATAAGVATGASVGVAGCSGDRATEVATGLAVTTDAPGVAVAVAAGATAPAMASSRGTGRVSALHWAPSHQRRAAGSVGSAYQPA
jgi:hypothetical protein